jgi:hypothetical protein
VNGATYIEEPIRYWQAPTVDAILECWDKVSNKSAASIEAVPRNVIVFICPQLARIISKPGFAMLALIRSLVVEIDRAKANKARNDVDTPADAEWEIKEGDLRSFDSVLFGD